MLRFMEITVHISDEVAAQARDAGLTAESYVEKLIVDHTSPRRQQDSTAARMTQLDEFLEKMAAHSAKIAPLPEEAFTRASFYADHD
jgi:hypothetical protein